jgi:hypothetical protein
MFCDVGGIPLTVAVGTRHRIDLIKVILDVLYSFGGDEAPGIHRLGANDTQRFAIMTVCAAVMCVCMDVAV